MLKYKLFITNLVLTLFFGELGASEEFKFRGDFFLSSSLTSVKNKQPLNSGNRSLEIPQQTFIGEVRPDLKWDFAENHFFVLRSSHDYRLGNIELTLPTEEKSISKGKTDLTDLFFTSDWTETFSTVIGLQSYQWGPGEFYSPTNPFFHFQSEQKKFFFKEKGRVLARANWNISDQLIAVFISEFMDNREEPWMTESDFEKKTAVKIDYQFFNPIHSIAFLYGKGDQNLSFFGAHGTYSPAEGISVYVDAKFTQGQKAFFPKKNIFGLYDLEKSDDTSIYTTSLVGFRFEDNFDFRQEFLSYDAGYTDEEWKNAKRSASSLSLNLPKNVSRFYKPGLEFKRKNYSYTSLRIPNLGSKDSMTISFRVLASLSENSQLPQLAYEHNLTDAMVGTVEYSRSMGNDDTELNLLTDDQISAGIRYAF